MSFGLFVFLLVLVAASLIFSIACIVYGKVKLSRAMRPIEYYPPRGYSPIDVLVRYKGYDANMHEVFTPLMLYWADRGFIKIEEDCKRGLKLTKLKDLEMPELPPGRNKQLIKNYKAEEELFNSIFEYGDEFYTLAAPEVYKNDFARFMKTCRKNAQSTRSATARKLSLATKISAFAIAVLVTLISGLTSGGPQYLMMIFPLVGIIAFSAIPNEGIEGIIKYPFFAVWGGVPLCAFLSFIPTDCAIVIGCAVVNAALIVTTLSRKIDIRTEKGLELYGRIDSFRTFLLDAEVDRLETLIEDDPDYYYNILPYCYVLKITEKLKPKFDRITTDGVSWYLGDLRDTLMF